ncbi:hypothetical protein PV10_08743 [Exophiala mesophila]|uniref:Uncharacterized protein n=1 Tax=Exophiala mesophila TaxID=212818 RepID=A0A0D1XLV2_EXOME|nr:uncharacterized protein PV10_08743 [Exophiala mesophila]KIV89151.1 hypothetical protein PV10_08743 [Exophiala mesophila]
MGNAISGARLMAQSHTQRKLVPTFVVTLDALGTLYGFRQPVATQYAEVARQCGLRDQIDPKSLNVAFKDAFKRANHTYPNYGKSSLSNPEQWWSLLVNDAFSQVVKPDHIPEDLGHRLYQHFSSADAYELYPDAQAFLESMKSLKAQYTRPDGPLVIVGVVTNSDPRVTQVLQSMQLQVGWSSTPPLVSPIRDALQSKDDNFFFDTRSPLYGAYNPDNDVDFVATSYEAGAEKPDRRIWDFARELLDMMPRSRAEQALDRHETHVSPRQHSTGQMALAMAQSFAALISVEVGETRWIHIGDDFAKDYIGAESVGLDALFVDRPENKRQSLRSDTQTVSNLQEAAMIVSLLAQQHIKANTLNASTSSSQR